MEEKGRFPHANDVLKPVARFFIGHRWLNLYNNSGRPQGAPYSLYWQDEINPVQHAMDVLEVFNVLAHILDGKSFWGEFWGEFHAAWRDDHGDGECRPDYNKEAWMYVQTKLESYFARKK